MGIFASPFHYAPGYEVGLNTGTPEVGGRIPRRPPRKPPQEEKVPSRVPNEGNGNGESSGARSGSASNGIGAGAANGAGIAAAGSSARSMMMQQDAESNNAANLSQSQFSTLIHPNPIQAPANPTRTSVAPAAQHPGFWGQVGHYASDIGNGIVSGAKAVNNFAQSQPVKDVMQFGSIPLPKAAPAPSSVVEPSNVYSPSRNFPEVSSGNPKVIQGSVEGPSSVASGAGQRALPRAYTSQADFENLIHNAGGSDIFNGSQFSGASSSPWYDSIGSDLGSIGEDIFAGL